MNDVFQFRDNLIAEYTNFSTSFAMISAQDIASLVRSEYDKGRYWPEPLIQINPNYQKPKSVEDLVAEGRRLGRVGEETRVEHHTGMSGRGIQASCPKKTFDDELSHLGLASTTPSNQRSFRSWFSAKHIGSFPSPPNWNISVGRAFRKSLRVDAKVVRKSSTPPTF